MATLQLIAAYLRFLVWHDSRKVEWWRILKMECVKSVAILVIWQILTKAGNVQLNLILIVTMDERLIFTQRYSKSIVTIKDIITIAYFQFWEEFS